ncbi:MAG: hypothetical protein COA73_01930 [Candidatus Hydrogenedentota bacterium]|nr:MAG: hypothetical protein COA73_01930 [Candidatus Hydrogenedentota bacterium]
MRMLYSILRSSRLSRLRVLLLFIFTILLGYHPMSIAQSKGILPQDFQKLSSINKTTRALSPQSLAGITPSSPNPYLSYLADGVKPDYVYWDTWLKYRSREKGVTSFSTRNVPISESEPNDTFNTADPIPGVGTGAGDDPNATLTGSLPSFSATPIGAPVEDDGSIPLATDLGLAVESAVIISGVIGDGPFGSAGTGTGDFDFYRVTAVTAGQLFQFDIDSVFPFTLDSFIVLWDQFGFLLDFDDDGNFSSFDSLLTFEAPSPGNFYLSVGSFGSFAPNDPFDSASGTGATSEGAYTLTVTSTIASKDYFSIELEAGDVIGITTTGSAVSISLIDPINILRVSSSGDLSGLYPAASPLPSGGLATLAYVAETSGTWRILVSGLNGLYSVQVHVSRPGRESGSLLGPMILYLDFDGGTIDASIFTGGPPNIRTISPLTSFFGNWSLIPFPDVVNGVIDSIIASVQESIDDDIKTMGLNPVFGIIIQNSRDHPDPGNNPEVTRILVGGTQTELGIGTIGIAESIDVGNFESQEEAIVLLDILSDLLLTPNSLNSYPVSPPFTKSDLIGTAVGNIVAHEAGHVLGSFHTDQFNPFSNIMDQGGNMPGLIGVGSDGIFGTADDIDVDFIRDVYVSSEGFKGSEDTLNTTAFGLTVVNVNNPNIPLQAWPIVIALAIAGVWARRRV